MGTKTWSKTDGTGGPYTWQHVHAHTPSSRAECFNTQYVYTNSGYIGVTSGRTNDNRYFDAIYPSGLGGVIDDRMSAHDMSSPAEAAKVWEKVKNGTYRGLEKLVWTRATVYSASDNSAPQTAFNVPDGHNASVGDTVWIQDYTDVYVETKITSTPTDILIQVSPAVSRKDGNHIVIETKTNTSVSGNFAMTDVIGSPENILLTDALKNGWQGSWIPVIPDGTSKQWQMTRKNISGQVSGLFSKDLGDSWSVPVWGVDSVNNSISSTQYVGQVSILTYQAYAKQTKPSINKPVLNGEAGVGSVFYSSSAAPSEGVLLGESTLGSINKANNASVNQGISALTDFNIRFDGLISNIPVYKPLPTHVPLQLGTPNNNSPAVKVLPYQISNNGQCSLGYQANELTYDTTAGNWGDSASTVTITTDGSDTFIDDSGNTNLSVVHELAKPYGATKNVARAGTSVNGVDL